MPRIGITAYDLLVSCPGDVEDYLEVINECVDIFNRGIGQINSAQIVVRHWSTDSYPESGGKPQELLNHQFVNDCDAAVALFGTRFGTKTDKYGSGTEEEVEGMLSANKQVFMYFIETPIDPATIDLEQFEKVRKFKDKYKDKGIFSIVKNKEDFRRDFANHLMKHFLPLVSGEKQFLQAKTAPNIVIQNESLDKEPNVVATHSHHLELEILAKQKEKCICLLNELASSSLPPRNAHKYVPQNTAISKLTATMNPSHATQLVDRDIRADERETITTFADENAIVINPNFWNMGNLQTPLFSLPAYGEQLNGTDAEKERCEKIIRLCSEIEEYQEYKQYFSNIDRLYSIGLVVTNNGNEPDDGIDIILTIDSGQFVLPQDLPLPEICIIEKLLKSEFVEYAYKIATNETIDDYPDYPRFSYDPSSSLRLQIASASSSSEYYDECVRQFQNSQDSIFNYERFEKGDAIILKFSISHLKHNTTIAFPSRLFFSVLPKDIKFEVKSEKMPNKVSGIITVDDATVEN